MEDYIVSGKRTKIIVCLTLIISVFLLGRLAYIQLVEGESLAAIVQSRCYTELPLPESRGDILDRNFKKLVNQEECTYFYISKDRIQENGVGFLRKYVDYDDCEKVGSLKSLYEIYRVTGLDSKQIQEIEEFYDCVSVNDFLRYGKNQVASHLVGYVNKSDNEGVFGLERAYRYILKKQHVKAYANIDAGSRIISWLGVKKEVIGTQAVVTNLDYDLQQRIEEILEEAECTGSIVVLDGESGQVLAEASVPGFNPGQVDRYLNSSGKELMNLGIQGEYPPGSVFKIAVTAAGLEAGLVTPETVFECKGYEEVNGIRIKCSTGGAEGHGSITFAQAFAKSCNSTFIQLGQQVGGERLLQMAEKLGVGQVTLNQLAEEADGNLPSAGDVSGAGIGNLSIGQGTLLMTPIQVAQMTQIIANDGAKMRLSLVKGFIDIDGSDELTMEEKVGVNDELASVSSGQESAVQVISQETAKIIQELMEKTVEEGTARSLVLSSPVQSSFHESTPVRVGGKTGSAQSTSEGEKVVHGWFTGYIFPLDVEGEEAAIQKKYVVTVMVEDGGSGSSSCLPLFQQILNYLMIY